MNEWKELTKEEINELIRMVCTQNLSLSWLIQTVNKMLKGKNHVS